MRYLLATVVCVLLALSGCGGGDNGTNVVDTTGGTVEGFVYANPATRGATPALAVAARVKSGQVPVPGATVSIRTLNLTTTTQHDGHFVLTGVEPGVHQLTIAHPQYRDPVAVNVTVDEGNVTTVESNLGVGYYICAGVGDYLYIPNDLLGPPNDARAMANVLYHSFYGNGTTLIDAAATKEELKQAITEAGSRMGNEDFLIFYFSGHGASFTVDGAWFDAFCPADLRDDNIATFVSDTELKTWLKQLPDPKRCVVILDTCYSGAFFDGVASKNLRLRQAAPLRSLRALQSTGCTVMSACAYNETAVEINAEGLFTRYLSLGLGTDKAIADRNHDREVTAQELYEYAAPRTTDVYPEQHPVIQVGSNPVLLRY